MNHNKLKAIAKLNKDLAVLLQSTPDTGFRSIVIQPNNRHTTEKALTQEKTETKK